MPIRKSIAAFFGSLSGNSTRARVPAGNSSGSFGTGGSSSAFGNDGANDSMGKRQENTEAAIPAPPPLRNTEDLKHTSEVQPADLASPPPTPTPDERRIVAEVVRQFQRASVHTAKDRRFSELCRRFTDSEQHLVIDEHKGIIDRREGDAEEYERSHTVNVIAPLIQKVVALITQNEPDVSVGPVADTRINREAASEARAAIAHSHRKWKHRQQIEEMSYGLLQETDHYIKVTWDKRAEALLPEYDPRTGELIGAYPAMVGDIHREVVSGNELFFDPAARSVEESAWVIHARNKPLSWFSEHYGKIGYYVRPDSFVGETVFGSDNNSDTPGTFDGNGAGGGMPSGRGDNARRPNAATCYELWEKPSGKFKKGRLIVVAGGRVLHYGPWPYDKKDKFPFAGAGFRKNNRSPRSFNLVGELLDCQVTINREWSRILSRLDVDKRVILTQKLSGTGADLADTYKEHRDLIEVFYNPGTTPPQIAQFPPINREHFEMLDRAYSKMQDISGIVDVLQGKAPSGITAGVAIDLLQSQSQSIFRSLITSVEFANVDIAEIEIALTAQYAIEERLVMMDDNPTARKSTNPVQTPQAPQTPPMAPEGQEAPPMPPAAPSGLAGLAGANNFATAPNAEAPEQGMPPAGPPAPPAAPVDPEEAPSTPMTRARSFKALNKGGKVYVRVEPGSATPRSIAGQNQFALELYDRQVFGVPGDPHASLMLLEAITFNGSDRLAEMARIRVKAQDQTNQMVADLQAQLGEAQNKLQQAEMALQAKAAEPQIDPREVQAMKHDSDMEKMHKQAGIDSEQAQEKALINMHTMAVGKQLDIDTEAEKKRRGLNPPPVKIAAKGKASK